MLSRDQAIAQLTAEGLPYALHTEAGTHGPLKVFTNAPATLRDLYTDAISDQTFIVYDDERFTFAETYALASQIGHLLVHQYGVLPGGRVAISMRNFPEWVTTFMAVTSIGAIAVAMNALWQPDEMEYGLVNSGAKVLFADQERLDRLAQCSGELSVRVVAVRPTALTAGAVDLADELARVGSVPMPDVAIAPTDAATIFYTSGSTGHPKGVVASHRNIISALFSWELDARAAVLQSKPDGPIAKATAATDRPVQAATLLAVPLFHVTGSHAVLLQSYRTQRKLVCMYKWDPEAAAELIERERVNTFVAPAAMTGDLVRVAKETARDLSSLQYVGGGGAPRAPEQVRQIDASFKRAMPNTGWGMTETNGIGSGIAGPDYLGRPASSGRCSAVLELRVVDDNGTVLPAGERGELQIRGTSMFSGYWNRPEVNADVFVDGDWFRTGDVAYLDDEGYLFIVDRIKDLIIRGGENIGCGQVEAALLMHPAVREAAVYAVPDERLGEEVGATVFATDPLDVDELRAFLGSHLARFEVPRYIVTVDEPLPRTASGKILKRQLRDEAVATLTTP